MGHAARFNPRSFQRQAPPTVAVDALGRSLAVGDLVVLPQVAPGVFFFVDSIRPNLQPGLPADAIILVLSSRMENVVKSGQPIQGVLLVKPMEDQPQQTEPDPATDDGQPADGPKIILPGE
jgi:hypothetical protein